MSYVNVGGVWKDGTEYVNVNGVWKPKSQIYTNVNGIWKGDNPYPKFNPNLAFAKGSGANHQAYREADGRSYYAFYSSQGLADEDFSWFWVMDTTKQYTIKKGDVLTILTSHTVRSTSTTWIDVGFNDMIPTSTRNNLCFFSANVLRPDGSISAANVRTTNTYLGTYDKRGYLCIELQCGRNYNDIGVSVQSVKLNGYEIWY